MQIMLYGVVLFENIIIWFKLLK